jgi:hypothetical protein
MKGGEQEQQYTPVALPGPTCTLKPACRWLAPIVDQQLLLPAQLQRRVCVVATVYKGR